MSTQEARAGSVLNSPRRVLVPHQHRGKTGALFSPMVSSWLWGAGDKKGTFVRRLPKTSLTPWGRKVHLCFPGAGGTQKQVCGIGPHVGALNMATQGAQARSGPKTSKPACAPPARWKNRCTLCLGPASISALFVAGPSKRAGHPREKMHLSVPRAGGAPNQVCGVSMRQARASSGRKITNLQSCRTNTGERQVHVLP